jgi:hypothetical protein
VHCPVLHMSDRFSDLLGPRHDFASVQDRAST